MRESQTTSDVLMIRPASFCRNEQTCASNRFQTNSSDVANRSIQDCALKEFDTLVKVLRDSDVNVHLFDDLPERRTPDALFPNNWLSSHADGTLTLYPMLAENRRLERRRDIVDSLAEGLGFVIARTVDLSRHERNGEFLEGTGSLVLDRTSHIAYACHSPRTHLQALETFASHLNYEVIAFNAFDKTAFPIYHTNVLMSIGARFALICTEAIENGHRRRVLDRLHSTGHELIEISLEQMHNFAGNILELKTNRGDAVVAMSDRAKQSLSSEQKARLVACAGPIVSAPIPTIEEFGGGSVRCMLAEIHLPRRGT